MTAKQFFDAIASSRHETAAAPYAVALDRFLTTRFMSTADDYIDRFLASFQAVNSAARGMNTDPSNHDYRIGNGLASAAFVTVTRRVEWLNTWRDTWAYEADNNSQMFWGCEWDSKERGRWIRENGHRWIHCKF
ncbi:hypothetical protein K3495_g8871 [Podosphaera aphanis]|nr:hypothetical protein K3495_g8871 [Podosphaera aphanis]